MKKLLMALVLFSVEAKAHVLNLDYSAFTVSKILCNRDYLVPELDCQDWRGGVALDADFSTKPLFGLTPLFFRNVVHGEGTDARFRTMGWRYELGLSILPAGLELGWSHHSRHALDQHSPNVFSHDWKVLVEDRFPVYDAIFLRFILTGERKK